MAAGIPADSAGAGAAGAAGDVGDAAGAAGAGVGAVELPGSDPGWAPDFGSCRRRRCSTSRDTLD